MARDGLHAQKPIKQRIELASSWLAPRVATLTFNFLQLGIVIHSLAEAVSLVHVGVLLLSFESAILLDCFIRFGSARAWSLTLAGGTVALYASTPADSGLTFGLQTLSIALCTFSLKKIRSITDASGSLKRYWRAYGYLAAGMFAPATFAVLALAVSVSVLLSARSRLRDSPGLSSFGPDRNNTPGYLCVMLHHWHYFSYAYLVPLALMNRFGLTSLMTGLIFYVGWVGYYLFLRVDRQQALLVAAGHILAAASVVGMMLTSTLPGYLLFWLLTGIGGGAIVLLRDLVIGGDARVYERFKIWEAVGHVLGIAFFLAGLASANLYIPVLSAVLAGLGCAVVAIWAGRTFQGFVSKHEGDV